jgi:hypothetical protein
MLHAVVRFKHREVKMAIEDYTVDQDYFIALTENGAVCINVDFAFPCCVCVYNHKKQTQYPC